MKVLRLLGLAIAIIFLSFTIVFLGIEIARQLGHEQLIRAKQPYDVVVINSLIIDGTGAEPFRAQVGIRNNQIVDVGHNLKVNGALIYDFAGFTIAPMVVEWLRHPDWVERDLPSALLRYPPQRLVIIESYHKDWVNKSVYSLYKKGITPDQLNREFDSRVMIIPMQELDYSTIPLGFYNLTGLRSEMLGVNIGKIMPGYKANLIVFNHRLLDEDKILNYLTQEEMPPYDFRIEGTEIFTEG